MSQAIYYHKYNYLKYRILRVLQKAKDEDRGALTSQDIANELGIPRHRVTDTLGKWHSYKYRYVKRLEKKSNESNGKAFRYIINSYGTATLKMYEKKIKEHKDLNCKSIYRVPKLVDSYLGITDYGDELGITLQDVVNEMSETRMKAKEIARQIEL